MSKKRIIVIYAAVAAIVAFALFITCLISVDNDEKSEDVYKNKEEPFCMLLMGKDDVSGLSDVIMLVSLDSDAKSAAVMQIPRDTYAEYSESGYKKINGAPKVLGEKGFCEFLEQNLGVNIDGYVSFDLDALEKAVDIIGGVEIELDKALNYEDPEQNLYIHLPKGKQTLDGKKAQMLVRFRKGYVRGDLDRLDVQKQFLAAFISRAKSSVNVSNIYGFATQILPLVDTDIRATKIVSLGIKALKIDMSSISLFTLPGEDARAGDNGASYYIMSNPSCAQALEKYFKRTSDDIDPNRLFCSSRYDEFQKIYSGERVYKVDIAKDLE